MYLPRNAGKFRADVQAADAPDAGQPETAVVSDLRNARFH